VTAKKKRVFTIVHEVPGRLRLRSRRLYDPSLDRDYLAAVVWAVPGVESAAVNGGAACIVIEYDGRVQTRRKVLDLLEDIPREAYMPEASQRDPMALSTVLSQGGAALVTPFLPDSVKAPLAVVLGLPTMAEGVRTLFERGVKVEVLDAAAVGFSLLRGDYSTANAIVALLGLGGYLEQWTQQKSDDLLKGLLRPQVETIWVERDACEVRVPFAELSIGEIVICGPGELVPVDGVITDGEAALNQSSITGESLPVHVGPGDDVLSGAVVEDGRLKIAARSVGRETSMARMGRFLENSLRTKSTSQTRSDEMADKLVPVTFALGLGLFALTRDVRRAASVLTVDYSCAIKLAAPVAVKSGMYAAGHRGVLLKGGQALDNLARVDTVVFDKTGTLTRGNLCVADIVPLDGVDGDALLAMAAGAEEHYGHPVARAVVAEALSRGLDLPPISQVDFIVAHGVSAFVEGRRVLVGSRHFLEDDEGVDCFGASRISKELRSQGKSLLYVAREGRLAGIIALQDELRPEAVEALRLLKERGVTKIVMLTGDHRDTARAIAASLGGIDEVHWELKPDDKAAIVRRLQRDGHFIAFAGDGVNDAPALVTADVGICMPGGADLAREAAQVVLLDDNLKALVVARDIAARTQTVLKRSFQAAVGINSAILLLATAGRLSPVASAFLHNASTLGILGYAAMGNRGAQSGEAIQYGHGPVEVS
jgi:Cu2+-exporting ATPase